MAFIGIASVIVIQVIINGLSNSNYDAFASVMVFLQITGMITRFQLRWHPNLTYVNIIMSIVNFDIDFFGPHCLLTGWNASVSYFVQLFVPFMIFFGLIIDWHVKEYFYKTFLRLDGQKEEVDLFEKPLLNKVLRIPNSPFPVTFPPKMLMPIIFLQVVFRWALHRSKNYLSYATTTTFKFMNIMYHTIAIRSFAVFVCTTEPNGKVSFMSFSPEITCGEPIHIAMMVLSAVYIPVVVLGWPMYCARALYKGYKSENLTSPEFLENWAWLFSKYSIEYCWWELLVLFRRMLLVLIVVFVSVPMLQAALAIILLCSMLTLQLSAMPFTNDRVDWLETFGEESPPQN